MARVYAITLGILGGLLTIIGIGALIGLYQRSHTTDIEEAIRQPFILALAAAAILIGTTWITSAVIISVLRSIEDQQRHNRRLHIAGSDDREDLEWAA